MVCLLSISPPTNAAEEKDLQAMDILLNMARTLAEAQQYSFTLSSSYDAPQSGGQMIEFGARRHFQIMRPHKIRVDLTRSDGSQRVLASDGTQLIIHTIKENVYARVRAPGTVDEVIMYLVSTLNVPLPLARLFRKELPSDLKRLATAVDYVEMNTLTRVPTDHVAVRSRDVDFQIWVSREKTPLPMRIVITYKNYQGEPQFRATFTNWNLTAEGIKRPFAYTMPQNAEQIPLLVRKRSTPGVPDKKEGAQ
jgi:hypothetical protein